MSVCRAYSIDHIQYRRDVEQEFFRGRRDGDLKGGHRPITESGWASKEAGLLTATGDVMRRVYERG